MGGCRKADAGLQKSVGGSRRTINLSPPFTAYGKQPALKKCLSQLVSCRYNMYI